MQDATELAKKEKKALFLNFTGSDWCRFCVYNEKNIFAKDEFETYAKKNLVCVMLDFPKKKKQAESVQVQNKKLREKYAVKGFPTYLVLSPEHELLGKFSGAVVSSLRFIEKLDAYVHPDLHKDKIEWLENTDFSDEINFAMDLAKSKNLKTVHFLDSSVFSNVPAILEGQVLGSSSFARYINKNYVALRTKVSTKFPPMEIMKRPENKATLEKFIAYAKDGGIEEANWDKYCYSMGEYVLREGLGCKRKELPAFAIFSADGNLIRVIKSGDYKLDSKDPVGDMIKLFEGTK